MLYTNSNLKSEIFFVFVPFIIANYNFIVISVLLSLNGSKTYDDEMNMLTISQFNNLLCFRLEDMSHENNLLVKEQKETVKQLHVQNETLTMSFKVRSYP